MSFRQFSNVSRFFSTSLSLSSKYRVLVTAGGVPKASIQYLEAKGCEIDQWPSESVIPQEELRKRMHNVDAVYCTLNDKIGKDIINAAGKRLKVIATMSVGTDHIDRAALKKRGIRLGYTPDVLTNACAELMIALTLTAMRRTFEAALTVRNGQWPDGWRPFWMCGNSIYNSVVGFVGFGRIGQAIAHRLKPFEPAKMLYSCQTRKDSALESKSGVTWCQNLDDLLRDADVVIVCCSLNEKTRLLFTKEKFKLMKKGSYFINASRGAVVDQDALVEFLGQGHFGGVGLDVTTPEPLPPTHQLLKFREVTVFPHIASADIATREKMGDITAKNIMAVIEGTKMLAEQK